MDWDRRGWCLPVAIIALAVNAGAQTLDDAGPPVIKEDDRAAPVDWGYGAGVRPSSGMRAAQGMMAAPAAPGVAAAPAGGADARTKGTFGPPITWPIIGLHAVLLPDGRVMSFGTGEKGQQGGQFVYDVWDPKLGTGVAAHMVLPNTTNTDVFCAGQSILAASGQVLMVGGDLTINGQRNFSNDRATVFSPQTNTIMSTANGLSSLVSHGRCAPDR